MCDFIINRIRIDCFMYPSQYIYINKIKSPISQTENSLKNINNVDKFIQNENIFY